MKEIFKNLKMEQVVILCVFAAMGVLCVNLGGQYNRGTGPEDRRSFTLKLGSVPYRGVINFKKAGSLNVTKLCFCVRTDEQYKERGGNKHEIGLTEFHAYGVDEGMLDLAGISKIENLGQIENVAGPTEAPIKIKVTFNNGGVVEYSVVPNLEVGYVHPVSNTARFTKIEEISSVVNIAKEEEPAAAPVK